jgi:hypothetical protein
MSDKNFPSSSSDSSKPILLASTLKGEQGNDAIIGIANPWNIAVPTDADGSNPVYTNANAEISIIEGNTILASGSVPNGWSLAVDDETNCVVSITDLEVSITSITDDTGEFTVIASKVGYNNVYITCNVLKNKQGATGNTGATGAQGIQGIQGVQGIQGNDGTGLVVQKYTIGIKDPVEAQTVDNGSGSLRINFAVAHGMSEGEVIYVSGPGGDYDGYYTIRSIIDADTVDTDGGFTVNETVDVWSGRHLKKGGTLGSLVYDGSDEGQILHFPYIIPVGAKLDEFAMIKLDGDDNLLLWSAGYFGYPYSGYNSYLYNKELRIQEQVRQVNLWDPTRSDYQIEFLTGGNNLRNLYLWVKSFSSSYYWNNVPSDLEIEMFISYKYFNTSL